MRRIAAGPITRNRARRIIFATGCFIFVVSVAAYGQYVLTWSSLPGGGGRGAGGSYTVVGTVGLGGASTGAVVVSNQFGNDPNCVALWRFEPDQLTTDSIGTNTLTNYGATVNSTTYREGAAAADFLRSSNQYLSITDAVLASGFPLKSGDTSKKISVSLWFRLKTITQQYLWAKVGDTGTSLGLYVGSSSGTYRVILIKGNSSDTNTETAPLLSLTLSANQWYHVGLTYDDTSRSYRLRVYDATADAVFERTGNFTNNIRINQGDLALGRRPISTVYFADAQLDECAVFKDILTAAEIDQVRQGTYGVVPGPTPDPMEWTTAPYATSSSQITMMAADAQDAHTPVQYYFKNVTLADGSHDSGWQTSRTYTDTGLPPDTLYEYKVKARGGLLNENQYSIPLSARTEREPTTVLPEGSTAPVSGELGNDLNLQVDPFTGSVGYTLPIALPPARQGSEPSLALHYGGGGNGWCGIGWSLGMGAIQRDMRKGVPVARDGSSFLNKYDDSKGFVAAFGAVNSRLVLVNPATHEYRAEADQAFLKYEYDAAYDPNGRWIVTDKSGNKFYFGRIPGEFQERMAGAAMRHPLFNSATKGENVFLWTLAKIEDISGNLTYIYYTEDPNHQIYLSEVRYNGHKHGPCNTTHSVQFVCEDREDQSVSYATGYRVETAQRLKEIRVHVLNLLQTPAAWTRVRSYHLTYENSPSTLRSLLKSVKMCGTSDPNDPDSYLPPVTFDYQQKPFEFDTTMDWGTLDSQSADPGWNSPAATSVQHFINPMYTPDMNDHWVLYDYYYDNTYVAFCDLNGDGLPDRVLRNASGYGPPNNVFKAQFNTGSGFTQLQNWEGIDAQGYASGDQANLWNSPRAVWSDLYTAEVKDNSVWVPARYVRDPVTGQYVWVPAHWDYEYEFVHEEADDVPVDLVDINGDGLADRVMRKAGGDFKPSHNNNVFKVQLNNGIAFGATTNWGPLYAFDHVEYGEGYESWDNQARVYNSTSATYTGENNSPTLVCLADMNHDGLLDRVLYAYDPLYSVTEKVLRVQFNSGNGFEDSAGSPVVVTWGPLSAQGSGESAWLSPRLIDADQETVIDLLDINGDGLPDRVMRKKSSPYNSFVVQFNTGYGFEKDIAGSPVLRNWGPVSGQGDTSAAWNSLQGVIKDSGTLFVDLFDINGDGLPDRVMREITPSQGGDPAKYDLFKVQLNTGTGFQKVGGNTPVFATWTGVDDQGSSRADWGSPHGVYHPHGNDSSTHVTMCDINGDGLPDRVMRKRDSAYDVFKVQINKGPFPDLLSTVTGKLGGSVSVEYKSSTDPEKHKDANDVSRLPFPVHVASLVDVNDGFGNHVLTQYDYARGFYDAARKEFSGFGLTTTKEVRRGLSGFEDIGTTAMMYFYQNGGYEDPNSGEWQDAGSVGKRGIPYRTEVYDNDGKLYKIATNKVEEVEVVPGTGWHFTYLAQATTIDYPGITYTPGSQQYPADCYRAKLQKWQYDTATGNLVKAIDLGEVSLGTTTEQIATHLAGHTYVDDSSLDDVYVHNEYAVLDNLAILDKIKVSKTTSDVNGVNCLTKTYYTYDPNGRLHTDTAWLDKDANGVVDANTAPLQYEYDDYGNRILSIDRSGIETNTTYDPNYHCFPVEKTTGGFVTSTDYDIRSALPIRTIDPAGMVTENSYDAFFRLTDVHISTEPNIPAELWQTHIDYNLGGIAGGLSYNYLHQVCNGYEAYTYNDGLGRIVQTMIRAETGAAHGYRVVAMTYDERGKVNFVTLPFFGDGPQYTSLAGQPGTLTEYDTLGRTWRVTPPAGETGSPAGSATTVYSDANDPWVQVSTDAEGKTAKSYFDAAGRTVQLVEVTSSSDIVTHYEYDRLGRLITTVDHAGHEFWAEYDSMGRKIRSVDPDMGTWAYAYDDASRMTEQVDSRSNRVSFLYEPDKLGRVLQKIVRNDANSIVETATYTYDQSDDPEYVVHKGQVYKVTDGQGWTKTGYDSRGRAIKSTRYLSVTGKSYTTQTAYDSADRVTQVAYPGNQAMVAHSYDSASHLIKVESLWGTGADVVFYQASLFNEDGQPTRIDFGNGVTTQTEFYTAPRRLKRTHTSIAASTVQDITYTYDKISNIKSVADAAHTGTQSCSLSSIVYDDLYRLTSLYSTAEAKTLTYEYTPLGNINKNGEMGTGTYTYSPTQPHAVTAANGSTYQYDAAGNMTARNRSGQPNQMLTYDAQNRLTRVDITGGSSVQFGYSVGGDRLWKKVNGQVTSIWIGSLYEEKNGKTLCHVYAGNRLVATFEPSGGFACLVEHNHYFAAIWHFGGKTLSTLFGNGHAPVTMMWGAALTGIALGLRYNRRRLLDRYGLQTYYGLPAFGGTDPWRQMVLLTMAAAVFLSSNPPAAYADTPEYDPVFYYYHPDHLGSSQVITDRDGDVVQQYGYSPFGREDYKNNAQAFSISDRYTGQTLDEETGLYYYGARYYDPELARFIQADPIIPDMEFCQALNRYTYCYNNPLKLTDPTGNAPTYEWNMPGSMYGDTFSTGGGLDFSTGWGAGTGWTAFGPSCSGESTALTSALTGNAGSFLSYSTYDVTLGYGFSYDLTGGSGFLDPYFSPWDSVGPVDLSQEAQLPYEPIVDAPGPWEGMIPMWGSMHRGLNDLEEGRYGWAAVNTGLFVSDFFLVRSIATVAGRGIVKGVGWLLGREAATGYADDVGRAAASATGKWVSVNEAMSARAAAYQAQITGRTGQAYLVNGVRFDGLGAKTLLETKGLGYARFAKNGQFRTWFRGKQGIVDQARRQINAANGTPIQWHIAEKDAIPAFRRLFENANIKGIELVHTPVAP